MGASLIVAYISYLVAVVNHLDGGAITEVRYQWAAVVAAGVVVVLAAITHMAIAAVDPQDKPRRDAASNAIRRYSRSTGATVLSAAAVLGMALAMAEAAHFWIANVILAGLVVAEVVAAGSEILTYRRRV